MSTGCDDLVVNYFTTPSAQTQLAAAGGRAPANVKAKATRPDPGAVRQGQQGRRPDAEHPADEQRLERSRPGVGPLDEGRRRNAGRALLQGRCSRDLVQDRLTRNEPAGWALSAAPTRRILTCPGPVSTATTPTLSGEPPPFPSKPDRRAESPSSPERRVRASRSSLLSSRTRSLSWASYDLISHKRWPALAVLDRGHRFIDLIYLVPRRKTIPAKFLRPGHDLPDRLPASSRSPSRSTSPSRTTHRAHPHQGPGDRAIKIIR